MESLLVVSGPPGAGKSTVARLLADRYESSALVEGDAFFGFLRTGAIEPWRTEAHEQNDIVTSIQAGTAGEYVRGGFSTVYDGVLGPWFLDRFAIAARVPLDYVVVLPTVDVCIDRIRTRVGHEFDDETATRSLHRQFTDAAIDAHHVIDGSALTPDQTADEIVRRRDAGSIRIDGD